MKDYKVKGQTKAPRQFCYSCGHVLDAELRSTTYDNDTGEPQYQFIYTYPNNKGKHFFFKHPIYEPVADY